MALFISDSSDDEDQNRVSAAMLRINTDITVLEKFALFTLKKDPKNPLHFSLIIKPSVDMLWYKGQYVFDLQIPTEYPTKPPKCYCKT